MLLLLFEVHNYIFNPLTKFYPKSLFRHVKSNTSTESRYLFKSDTYWNKVKKNLFHGRNRRPMRPMYRDDIFYGGSLMVLPEYKKSMAGHSATTHRSCTQRDVGNNFISLNSFTNVTIQQGHLTNDIQCS